MIELRPQPVGIFPPPAANLLLPMVDDDLGALEALSAGDLDVEVPEQWAFFVSAARGEPEKAIELLSSCDAPLATYNRFVLEPGREAFELGCRTLTDDLGVLLGVAAYSSGVADYIETSFPLDGELLALALATSAASELEKKNVSEASAQLKAAVVEARECSPLLAGVLLSQHADLMVSTPGFVAALATQEYKEAIRLAGDCKLPMFLSELYTRMGMVFQNAANGQRGALLEAVNCYQSALQNGITEEEQPELFAQLQNNLGLAYLSMPALGSSNQLRTGIAVQSFRHALKIYTKEEHPDMWASVSMNLANALQHAPSSHPEENLIKAVESYEEVLEIRSRAKDPVAYALVLLNQANALAHLGIFKPAIEKLSEAYKLFHWYERIEQANAAKELVDQINQRMGDQGQPFEVSSS